MDRDYLNWNEKTIEIIESLGPWGRMIVYMVAEAILDTKRAGGDI